MEVSELNTLLSETDNLNKEFNKLKNHNELMKSFISETNEYYKNLSVKEALVRMVSEHNYKVRGKVLNCEDIGVKIRIGDICYVDFGLNYLNEAGFQHFALIVAIKNHKALVIPMTSNSRAVFESKHHKKPHLLYLGKLDGMNKESALFLNDMRFINTARIIDVKAHLKVKSFQFKQIKNKIIEIVK